MGHDSAHTSDTGPPLRPKLKNNQAGTCSSVCVLEPPPSLRIAVSSSQGCGAILQRGRGTALLTVLGTGQNGTHSRFASLTPLGLHPPLTFCPSRGSQFCSRLPSPPSCDYRSLQHRPLIPRPLTWYQVGSLHRHTHSHTSKSAKKSPQSKKWKK